MANTSQTPLQVVADTSFLVGRFQVHDLTIGHKNLILSITQRANGRVVIFLGVSPFLSKDNPLDFASRARMIQESFPGVMVLPIYDNESDVTWSQNLDQEISRLFPHGRNVIFGGRDSFIERYHGKYETVEFEGDRLHTGLSGTMTRRMLQSEVRGSEDFRAGVIYGALNQWAQVMPTVDILLVLLERESGSSWTDDPGGNMKRTKLALIRKKGETFWRLPGGFVDRADGTMEKTAIREMKEETGVDILLPEYLGSRNVDDWRQTMDKSFMTSVFFAQTSDPDLIPGDDAMEAQFFPLKDVFGTLDIMGGHQEIIDSYKNELYLGT